MIEIIGFLAGTASVTFAAWAFIRFERSRGIAAAYGLEAEEGAGGNALIWPSR